MNPIRNTALALVASLSLLAFQGGASALTLNIGLDAVTDFDGNPVPQTALALIVVDKDGDSLFDDPLAGWSTAVGAFGNDFIAWRGDFSGAGVDGVFFDAPNFNIGTVDIPFNSALALFWFPDLTSASSTILSGTSYGFYSTTNASQFSSDSAWNTGANNGATLAINAFTINNTGNLAINPDFSGLADDALKATVLVVPEPGTLHFLLVSCLVFLLAFIRRPGLKI